MNVFALKHHSTTRDLRWLFLIALLVIGAGIGLRDPWPADEPRFALIAQQMVESGDWLFPRRGIELYADKPPMLMWMQAAAYQLIGNWRVAFLLPSLLAALGTLWLVYDLGRRMYSRRSAWWAAAMLLLTAQFVFYAKHAQIDALVTFLITLGCYGMLRHLLTGPAWGWYWMGWFAAGLGIITKGVGVLVLLLLLPYAFARWRQWHGLAQIPAGGWRWWVGPLFMLAAIALWLLPMWLAVLASGNAEYRAYAHDILFRQTVTRYTGAWHHIKAWWYFGAVMLQFWLPLCLLWPWIARAWWSRLRRHDARILLPLAWVVLVLLFFQFSSGKRDVYILPALPMLALASAPMIAGIVRQRGFQLLAFVIAVAVAVLLLVAGIAALVSDPPFELRLDAARGFAVGSTEHWWMLTVVGALGVAGAAGFRWRRGLQSLAFTLAAIWVVALGFWGVVLLNDASSARAVMIKARAAAGSERIIGLVAWKEQNLLMLEGPAIDFGFTRAHAEQRRAAIAWLSADPLQRRVFILEQALGPCVARDRATALGVANRRSWWLLGADALIGDCVDAPANNSPLDTTADPALAEN